MDVAADVVCIAAPSSKEANQVADNFGLLDLTEEGGFERFVPCAEKDGEPYPHFYGTPVEEMAHNSGDSENVICCTIIHYDETTKKMVLWSA